MYTARRRLTYILALILCAAVAGCAKEPSMREIARFVYTSDSGSILPELQWHEQIIIAADRATLTRNGKKVDTQVNAGTWEFAVDAQNAAALFARLEAVDCSALRRIEPEDAPDGGGAASYTIIYADDRECVLTYDPGTTYAGGDAIVEPVGAFIRGLTLPAGAASRYAFAPP